MRRVVDTQSFEHRVKVRGRDEIARLAAAFNQMLDRLARHAARRHASEEALRESEARFRSLFDNAPAGIHFKDLDGRYLLGKHEIAKDEKVQADDVVGKTNADFFPHKGTGRKECG